MLPESIGGLNRSGEPSGVNMEQRGQEWAALEQEYTDDRGKDLKLRIVSGPTAPGMKEFNTMKQFTVDTPQRKVKTLEISGATFVGACWLAILCRLVPVC